MERKQNQLGFSAVYTPLALAASNKIARIGVAVGTSVAKSIDSMRSLPGARERAGISRPSKISERWHPHCPGRRWAGAQAVAALPEAAPAAVREVRPGTN